MIAVRLARSAARALILAAAFVVLGRWQPPAAAQTTPPSCSSGNGVRSSAQPPGTTRWMPATRPSHSGSRRRRATPASDSRVTPRGDCQKSSGDGV